MNVLKRLCHTHFNSIITLISTLGSVTLIVGCSGGTKDPTVDYAEYFETPLEMLVDFNDDTMPNGVWLDRAQGKLVEDGDGNKLLITFDMNDNQGAGITIQPETPWDWSAYNDFAIALDAKSVGSRSTQIFFSIGDKNGGFHSRSVVIKPGETDTYYSELKSADFISPEGKEDVGSELNQASGLRGNPPKWTTDATPFIWMWGQKNLDFGAISYVRFHLQDALLEKNIEIDNIRVIQLPPVAEDPTYMTNILDKFGQNARAGFPEKILSDADFATKRDTELAELDGELFPGRSKFGGWKDGPKLEATGYFRTEKYGDRWSLVDPEGYLYIATGIDSVRLGDTSTLTGYSFDPQKYSYESNHKGTYRDKEAESHRYLASDLRADMFEWLPEYGSELSNHYGFVPGGLHSGALKAGETFNFYSANLERKYGEATPGAHLEKWREVSVNRMLNWGFTSFGNWTDPSLFDNRKVPFFTHIWTTDKRYKTVSSGNDFWWAEPDVFDPVWEEVIEEKISAAAKNLVGNPWCVGVFVDNEKSWGRPESVQSHYGIVINTLGRDGAEVPTKATFTKHLKAKYGDIGKLNNSWGNSFASWAAFDKEAKDADISDTQLEDYGELLYLYGDKYFEIIDKYMTKYLPDHLYVGARFADWGMPKEVVKASTKYVDVVSFNLYKEGLREHKWGFLEELDMPTIIGEFHFGSISNGHFHPGLVQAVSQFERGEMFKDYMRTIFDNPYFIGAHWFQYVDSPITGRTWDGENYNVGFVSVTDTPYTDLINASKELHMEMYERRFGEIYAEKQK